jgi:O-antigen ligase
MVASRRSIKFEHIGFLLLLLSWLNPLHIGPWISWHNEVLAFASGTLIFAGVLYRLQRSHSQLNVPYSALIWPGLASVLMLQYLWGKIEYFGHAIELLFYLGILFLTQSAGFALGRNSASKTVHTPVLTSLSVVILLGAMLSTIVALAQTFDVWEQSQLVSRTYGLRRPGGNIAQPNQLATLLLMGIVSLNYLCNRTHIKGVAALTLFGFLLAGLGLTESRSGLLGATVLLVFACIHRKRALASQPAWYPAIGLVFLLICFKFLPLLSYYLQQAGEFSGPYKISTDLSAGSRLAIWPQLLDASLQHPWLGWGLHQVPMAHNAVLHEYSFGEAFTYSHNIILDLVLGVGYPLGIAAIGLFMYWATKRLRKIENASDWYCAALLISLLVHSLLEFPFAYAYFLVPVFLAIGVLEARLFPDNYLELKWAYATLGHILFVLLLIWSVWEYIQIEEDYRVARFEALRIGKTPAGYDRPHILLLTQLDAMLTGIRLVPEPGMSQEKIEAARNVAMRFPWPATQNRYALTLALNGNANEAIRQLKVMRAMHGAKTYQGIKGNWEELANGKYPQLKEISLP